MQNEMSCSHSKVMAWDPVGRVWRCQTGCKVTDVFAAAHRMGPFSARSAEGFAQTTSAPPLLPGYRWTGEFYERVGPAPADPMQWRNRSTRAHVPWLRIALWFAIALLVLRLI